MQSPSTYVTWLWQWRLTLIRQLWIWPYMFLYDLLDALKRKGWGQSEWYLLLKCNFCTNTFTQQCFKSASWVEKFLKGLPLQYTKYRGSGLSHLHLLRRQWFARIFLGPSRNTFSIASPYTSLAQAFTRAAAFATALESGESALINSQKADFFNLMTSLTTGVHQLGPPPWQTPKAFWLQCLAAASMIVNHVQVFHNLPLYTYFRYTPWKLLPDTQANWKALRV